MDSRQLWLDSLGGSSGEQFKKALNSPSLMADFVHQHLVEARTIEDSYFRNFKQPCPSFLPFMPEATPMETTPSKPEQPPAKLHKPHKTIHIEISGTIFWVLFLALFYLILIWIKNRSS